MIMISDYVGIVGIVDDLPESSPRRFKARVLKFPLITENRGESIPQGTTQGDCAT